MTEKNSTDKRSDMKYDLPEKVKIDIFAYAEIHGIKKVILFGSRARGDNTERSDIDLAVMGGDFDGFSFAMNEQAETLLTFDVVDLDKPVSDELKTEIERDGAVIYEKI